MQYDVFLHAIFFSWNILALRGIYRIFKFLNLWKKKKVSLIDEELYGKFCPTVKVYVWFIKDWTYDSSADEITVFIWDGKVAKVNNVFGHSCFFFLFFPPVMILKPWILTLWAAPIVLWQGRAYLPEVGVTVTVYEQTTQNLAEP